MIDLSPGIVTIIMLGGILLGVLTGYPLAMPIGAIGLFVGLALFGTSTFPLFYSRMFHVLHSYPIVAGPLFVFMGIMLERSGIADRMFDALYLWLGGLRGGLAVSTVLIGTIMATSVGIVGASTTMLTLVALPSMLKRGYSKSLATGSICAGGVLGILIPPSIMLVVYGPMAYLSVGKLFMGAFLPGFLLSSLYFTYIIVRCLLQPNMAPAVSAEERRVPFKNKMKLLFVSLIPPLVLMISVLGAIFMGVASPTEAAGIGAFVATILVIINRKFNLRVLFHTALDTLRLQSMMLIVAAMSFAFVGVFLAAGCGTFVQGILTATPGGRWGFFVLCMFIVFILGFFMDWIGIVFIVVPIVTPVAPVFGFDEIWFAIMICVNLQMAYMTPPFAPAIFYVRGTADPSLGITTTHIIRGVIPFVTLVILGISLCALFPQIVTWLPSMMIR